MFHQNLWIAIHAFALALAYPVLFFACLCLLEDIGDDIYAIYHIGKCVKVKELQGTQNKMVYPIIFQYVVLLVPNYS